MAQVIIILLMFGVYLEIIQINKKVDKNIESTLTEDPKKKIINTFWNIITWLVLIIVISAVIFYVSYSIIFTYAWSNG